MKEDRITPENAAIYKGKLIERRESVSGHMCWYEPVVTEWKPLGLPREPEEVRPITSLRLSEEIAERVREAISKKKRRRGGIFSRMR